MNLGTKQKTKLAGVLFAGVLTTAGPAQAYCCAEAPQLTAFLYSEYLPQLVQTINVPIIGDITKAILTMQNALQQQLEINRKDNARVIQLLSQAINQGNKEVAMAQIQANTSIAQFQQQHAVQMEAAKAVAKMQQPVTTCQAVKTAQSMEVAQYSGSQWAEIIRHNNTALANALAANRNWSVNNSYNNVKAKFANDRDVKRGTASSLGTAIPDGDTQAKLLFGDGVESTRNDDQGTEEAIQAVIDNLSGRINTPEDLTNPEWEKTPQGKEYVMMQRGYMTYQNLSAVSLTAVASGSKAVDGLKETLEAVGIKTKKDKIGYNALVAEFIKAKFSPKEISSLATATDPMMVLRSMAQMQAFDLLLSHRQLSSIERQEALLAAQNSAMIEASMAPKLKEAREAAVRAATR